MMIGTQDLSRIIALALASAYVKGDKPLSLLILSDRPESGKTEMVKDYLGTPFVEFATDISGYGLLRDYGDKILNGKINHIIIPEFLKPLSKGQTATNNFTSTLQELMEDGLFGSHTGFQKATSFNNPDKVHTVGFIACMPRLSYSKELKRMWTVSGFLSRWLLVTYKYSDTAIDNIFASIRRGEYLKSDNKRLKFDGNKVNIIIPENIGLKCEELGKEITKNAREAGALYGYREVKHIRSLVSANVILDRITNHSNRDTVTMEDYNEIEKLGYLFNEQFNALRE